MLVTALPKLHATSPDPLPFAPDVHVRAFVLERDAGDLLVYAAPSSKGLGNVEAQYLNHWHESLFASDRVGAALQPRGGAGVGRQEDARGRDFLQRHMVGDDFEVIPTPGHTSGSTAFLWKSGKYRFLFTGDQIYLKEGEWVAAVLQANPRNPQIQASDRDAYIQSLELIRELEFDVLVPWVATAGSPTTP